MIAVYAVYVYLQMHPRLDPVKNAGGGGKQLLLGIFYRNCLLYYFKVREFHFYICCKWQVLIEEIIPRVIFPFHFNAGFGCQRPSIMPEISTNYYTC